VKGIAGRGLLSALRRRPGHPRGQGLLWLLWLLRQPPLLVGLAAPRAVRATHTAAATAAAVSAAPT